METFRAADRLFLDLALQDTFDVAFDAHYARSHELATARSVMVASMMGKAAVYGSELEGWADHIDETVERCGRGRANTELIQLGTLSRAWSAGPSLHTRLAFRNLPRNYFNQSLTSKRSFVLSAATAKLLA